MPPEPGRERDALSISGHPSPPLKAARRGGSAAAGTDVDRWGRLSEKRGTIRRPSNPAVSGPGPSNSVAGTPGGGAGARSRRGGGRVRDEVPECDVGEAARHVSGGALSQDGEARGAAGLPRRPRRRRERT